MSEGDASTSVQTYNIKFLDEKLHGEKRLSVKFGPTNRNWKLSINIFDQPSFFKSSIALISDREFNMRKLWIVKHFETIFNV